jgi:hypothetical protein
MRTLPPGMCCQLATNRRHLTWFSPIGEISLTGTIVPLSRSSKSGGRIWRDEHTPPRKENPPLRRVFHALGLLAFARIKATLGPLGLWLRPLLTGKDYLPVFRRRGCNHV